jgi:hydrogenase-4 component E
MTSGFDHALVGALLLTGFLMLPSRRPVILLRLLAAQGALLALAAAWQAWAQESLPLAVVALVVLGSQFVAVPVALGRLEWGAPEPGLPILPAMLLGCGLVALAILVVLPVAPGVTAMARQDLALILAFLLVGLLGLAWRRPGLGQAASLIGCGHALMLAIVSARGMPFVLEITIGLMLLLATGLIGLRARLLGGLS